MIAVTGSAPIETAAAEAANVKNAGPDALFAEPSDTAVACGAELRRVLSGARWFSNA